ncbi:MAG: hypothetical protein GF309_00300 [Candidatus Lokiarchaeota archaeon]|nr:hypothetical protein [Candidatus Lokiarchaeota archaeon]
MLKRKHVIFLSLIMLMSLSYIPSEVFSVDNSTVDSLIGTATPAEIMPRNIRVGVYDEPNKTAPDWAYGGDVNNDSSDIGQILEDAGYEVHLLTFQNLLDHELVLSEFDVFVIPDNLLRENVTMLAKSFWLSGGGILSIDSAANFLGYAGIIPYESEGDHGYGTYWSHQSSDIQAVANLHPATKSFSVGDEINITSLLWSTFDWSAISSTTEASEYVKLLYAEGDSNKATGIAYEPELRGGRVVHLPGYAQNLDEDVFIVEEMESMWIDAIEWLCPIPKSRIAFDISHQPRLGFDPWDEGMSYPDYLVDFRDHLVTHSFTVEKIYPSSEGNLTEDNLAPYDILILTSPDYNYTNSERSAVEAWIDSGGSLLVLGEALDQITFGKASEQVNSMIAPFDIEITQGYSSVVGDILYHPIKDSAETVQFASGGYINITGDAFPLVKKNGNIHIAATEYGNGRVIVSGDMNWADKNNLASEDNEVWALNIVNWLGSVGADTLLYCDDVMADDFYETPAAKALNELRINYFLVTYDLGLNITLDEYEWEHVIVDAPNRFIDESIPYLIEHVENDGYLAMHNFDFDNPDYEPLLNLMGVSYADDYPLDDDFYVWDQEHPVYVNPIDLGETSFSISGPYGDDGDLFHVFDNATALGGSSSLPQNNKCALAVRKDRKTIAMGYIFDQIVGDSDDSAYLDSFELWLNVVAHLFAPTIDSPADVSFTEGETGNSITWNPVSYHPAEYVVKRNGTIVDSGSWDGGPIEVNLDTLEAANYTYVITAIDWTGNKASDVVFVEVEPGAGGGIPGLPDKIFGIDTWIVLAAVGAVVLILIIVLARRK